VSTIDEQATPPTAPLPKEGEDDGSWICQLDLSDEFSIGETYATRQEAINGYVDEHGGAADGEHFHTGKLQYVKQYPPCPFDSSDALDRAQDSLHGEWWDSAIDNWSDEASKHEGELEGKFEEVWQAWVEKHELFVSGYHVNDIESHTVGEDETDEELARRAKEESKDA